MSAELVSCPECHRKLRVPGDLVGKLVKCPTCGQTFTANPETQAPPPLPPEPEEKPTRTSKVSRDDKDDEEDDDDRSRRRRASSRRDNDDDRGRRRRSRYSRDDDDDEDDDDDDDRGRRRRRRDWLPHRGGVVLTLGILSLVLPFVVPLVGSLAGLICGIIAWSMGNTDMAEMRMGRMDPEGESTTNGGRICGMISVILHVVSIVLLGMFFMCACLGAAGRH
jgi:predicted Zn finger-like uncharacterized protein